MNTFEVKQAAIRNVEQYFGESYDITNKTHSMLVSVFIAGAHHVVNTPHIVVGAKMTREEIKAIIISVVTKFYGLSLEEMKEKTRTTEIRQPRQVLSTLLVKVARLSTVEVGQVFFQDHSTIVHNIKAIDNLVQTNEHFNAEYQNILKEINTKCDKYIKI